MGALVVNIVPIESADPAALADYRDLTDAALRKVSEPAEGLYIAESLTILERALQAGHTPRSVLTSPKWLEPLETVLAGYPGDVPVFVGSDEYLESLTGFHVHRGTLASMTRPVTPPVGQLLDTARTVVVLEDIVDHTNVGAVFRSVAAMGADAVIVTERCADPLYRRSVRVSMGTVLQVPWTRASWEDIVSELRQRGTTLVGLGLTDDAVDFDNYVRQAPSPLALALGSEGPGLSAAALADCGVVAKIPMGNGVDSLNVAAAAAVALHSLRLFR